MDPVRCPKCGETVHRYRNPFPTADVVIYEPGLGVVLIRRANVPHGLALPGGFVDEGESVEHAAVREMKEETGLDVELLGILGVYSNPARDPRFHTMTVTYVGKAKNPQQLAAGDDAAQAAFYAPDVLPEALCFDHDLALEHFRQYLKGQRPLLPCADPGNV